MYIYIYIYIYIVYVYMYYNNNLLVATVQQVSCPCTFVTRLVKIRQICTQNLPCFSNLTCYNI